MKVIKVYYKGTCQEFSVGDGTTSEEIFELMKRIFFIKEDISNYFLQDSEGRVVILPKILPEELSVFLYIRPNNAFPIIATDNMSNLSINTNNQTENSQKWGFICTKGTESQLINGTHYLYINDPPKNKPPCIISSIEFSNGKHFIVIKFDAHECGRIGLGEPGHPPEFFGPLNEGKMDEKNIYSSVGQDQCDQLTKLIGIAIDNDSKVGYFLNINSQTFKPFKIIKKVTDLPESVIIFAGVKSFQDCMRPPYTGILLVKDSLPFPDLRNLAPEETISWKGSDTT